MIEAVVLAGLGGIAGITIGVAITVAAAWVIPQVVPNFGARQLSPIAIMIAFTVSLAIGGVIAGVYAAYRAAHLRPVEALRYESGSRAPLTGAAVPSSPRGRLPPIGGSRITLSDTFVVQPNGPTPRGLQVR